ncbi:MAG: plasmid pRiA4b ORF-3 family protein [Candidatus Magasanikbacteria bacterium]|nr:plasmid pRiA4b ORF-3 family protein [Candidatus Magasanikbacteria bacterium]
MSKQNRVDYIFQFKITLNDSNPKIWRRILVPADYTFFDLYCATEDAMGWSGGHLHAFYIDKRGERDMITIEFPDPESDDPFRGDTRDERKEFIADYFGEICKQCIYCYDMGDNWDHTILFERVVPRGTKTKYPQCVAGENACPPEDCGGIGGYEDLQKIIKDPNHPEHAEMMDWLCIEDPKELDPRKFDLSEVDFGSPRQRLKEWKERFEL